MCTQVSSQQKKKKNYTSKYFSFIGGVVDTGDKHSFAIISANFRKKFEMIPMRYSEARGTLIYEKNLKSKISCQTPFKDVICLVFHPLTDDVGDVAVLKVEEAGLEANL
jgi:hypothetical protein